MLPNERPLRDAGQYDERDTAQLEVLLVTVAPVSREQQLKSASSAEQGSVAEGVPASDWVVWIVSPGNRPINPS